MALLYVDVSGRQTYREEYSGTSGEPYFELSALPDWAAPAWALQSD